MFTFIKCYCVTKIVRDFYQKIIIFNEQTKGRIKYYIHKVTENECECDLLE